MKLSYHTRKDSCQGKGCPQVTSDYDANLVTTFIIALMACIIGVVAVLVAVGVTIYDLFFRDD